MIRPRLMEQVERAAVLYDEEVRFREEGRHWEANPEGDPTGLAQSYFRTAELCRKERLALLRRIALI